MSIERRATKIYLKELPPLTVLELLDKYHIPSPYKEILIAICVERLKDFPALDFLEEKFKIHIGYWDFRKKTSKALDIFRKSHLTFSKKNSIK